VGVAPPATLIVGEVVRFHGSSSRTARAMR